MSDTAKRFADLRLKSIYRASDDRLRSFYNPALSLAVHYDRMVGYWRSSSLAVAATGIARFIRNALEHGGRMRVIAGAQLTEADIQAITEGEPISEAVERRLLSEELAAVDDIIRERLRLLAWMVREGLLEFKIGIPTDEQGRPLSAEETDRYFHTKYGILTDSFGDRIAFVGSVNESAQGWQHNHEMFSVYRSWIPGWEEYGRPLEEEFEDHWETERQGNWLILDLPDAVRRNLIRDVPDDWAPPPSDPVEMHSEAAGEIERIRMAPQLAAGGGVGFATLPFEPWPHQVQIAARIIDTWPRSYLLADEVGLGKTIEAGMVIREALLSGRAKKTLLLVPASVQRQWQEELWEKFCLDVPSYIRGKFYDYDGNVLTAPNGESPWDAFPVVLASWHLARHPKHRETVLESGPWDLVLVDEAHNARRRGLEGQEGANQLLRLLREMKRRERWKVLLLASATPMQMNTFELYDLLDLMGLPGSWGQGEKAFEFYYRQLAEPDYKAREWPQIRQMLSDFFDQPEVGPNRIVEKKLRQLSPTGEWKIRKFHSAAIPTPQLAAMTREEKEVFDQWLRAHTPVRDRVFRTTRVALREYQRVGLLAPDATIPRRVVEDRRIQFGSVAEEKLYERIEEYISRYYQKYEQDKKTRPLGWIMTVYRRRLTSSLAAIHKSLARRMEAIQGRVATDDLLDDDDRFALEGASDIDFEDLSEAAIPYAEELAELQSFIGDLEKAIPHDTKGRDVVERIRELFLGGSKSVVVFTQFTDTLGWLRDQLAAEYGDGVACYMGGGGSRWSRDTRSWEAVDKETVKELFRKGEIRILIGTDAMSEGLNLQTSDQLINYDMPWNFMRVEQRIGRIDRINGQPIVHITNYFYEGTVEDKVYSGIQEDAEWFRHVVGPAQPVLGQVEGVIERLALSLPGARRDVQLEEELERVRMDIEEYRKRPLTLSALEASEGIDDEMPSQPLGLREIEETLLRNPLTASRMHPHPELPHTYWVEHEGQKVLMTFDRKVYDENPDIGFMTYGHSVFERLLEIGS